MNNDFRLLLFFKLCIVIFNIWKSYHPWLKFLMVTTMFRSNCSSVNGVHILRLTTVSPSIFIARLSFIGKGVWDPQKMVSLRFFKTFPNQKRQLHCKVLNWTKRSGSTRRRAHSLCYSFPCATYFSLCKLLIEAVSFKALTAQKGEYYSIKM